MTPAPWYEDALPGLRAPRSPAYNLSATVRSIDTIATLTERLLSGTIAHGAGRLKWPVRPWDSI